MYCFKMQLIYSEFCIANGRVHTNFPTMQFPHPKNQFNLKWGKEEPLPLRACIIPHVLCMMLHTFRIEHRDSMNTSLQKKFHQGRRIRRLSVKYASCLHNGWLIGQDNAGQGSLMCIPIIHTQRHRYIYSLCSLSQNTYTFFSI